MTKRKPELLPVHERLFIERRRTGQSQARAARRYGVSLYQYRQWENAEEPPPAGAGDSVGELEPHEWCLLERLRSGLPSTKVARAAGCSRWWLTQMERGLKPADRLLAAWRKLKRRRA